MPSQKKATIRPSATTTTTTTTTNNPSHRRSGADARTRPQANAFSAHFLDTARRRETAADSGSAAGASLADTRLSGQAHWAGPWDVETVPAGDGVLHVVTRKAEPAREGGGARLAFLRRQDALLAAAALAALATPNHLTLNTDKRSGRRSPLGYPIHDGGRHLGHISRPEIELLAAFHTLRALTADPDAGALYIEAQDPETLNLLGRAIMRRMGC